MRLDTTFEGYGDITFYADSTKCAAYKIGAYYDDGSSGRVVIFYLESRITEVISLEVGATEVEFSSGGWLAYNDWADLWIYNSLNELVFKKGGSYARYGECMWQHIADIRWSPDGRSCVFKYYPGLATETQYELYEARLPGPGEESDTTVQK